MYTVCRERCLSRVHPIHAQRRASTDTDSATDARCSGIRRRDARHGVAERDGKAVARIFLEGEDAESEGGEAIEGESAPREDVVASIGGEGVRRGWGRVRSGACQRRRT